MDYNHGRAWVIDGDIYFSPNCCRDPGPLPDRGSSISFVPGVSRADEFQTPRWWAPSTEWMGFVPLQPVPYSGVWFESLALLPRSLDYSSPDGYHLPGPLREQWLAVETLIHEVVRVLYERSNFRLYWPFLPSKWGYNLPYLSSTIAFSKIKHGRDWFAMWVGLLFWITRKIPEDAHFVDGLMPPRWFVMVIQHMRKQAAMDSIRMAPLLRTGWDVSRVGLWLLPPLGPDASTQPSPSWFIHNQVPVWYRWGREERSNLTRLSNLGYPAPLSEHIQAATTWISPSLTVSPPPTALDFFDQNQSIQISPMSPVGGGIFGDDGFAAEGPPPPTSAASVTDARAIWDKFFSDREARHELIKAKETPAKRQARESRQRNPPTVSASVYLWDWDLSDPPQFVKTLVPKRDREETLDRSGSNQKRYDSFFNDWHCCWEWGSEREDTPDADLLLVHPDAFDNPPPIREPTPSSPSRSLGPVVSSDGAPPPTVPTPPTPLSPQELLKIRAYHAVKESLFEWFGFVSPIPEPSSHPGLFIAPQDTRALILVLGLANLLPDNPFFDTPLGIICIDFMRFFVTDTKSLPPPYLWDLSDVSPGSLLFSNRLSAIRLVKNENCKLFMFDFGSSTTTPWKIAVYTATAALYVCRLGEALREEDVALHLVSSGIPFRTLQALSSLPPAPVERVPPILVPMRLSGHEFNEEDYAFYLKQCRFVMSVPRARAALLRGGYVWRVALDHIRTNQATRGPSGLHPDRNHMFVVRDSNGVEYADDELTPAEYDVLLGLYKTFTGKGSQITLLSWYPLLPNFEGSADDVGFWTDRHAERYNKRRAAISDTSLPYGHRSPLSAHIWKNQLRGFTVTRRAKDRLELLSADFLKQHVGTF